MIEKYDGCTVTTGDGLFRKYVTWLKCNGYNFPQKHREYILCFEL